MYKSRNGIKSKIILELITILYILISVLVNKFIFEGKGTGFIPVFISWIIVYGCFSIYNKKHNDLVDESSEFILLKVNQIEIKIMLYLIFIIALFFATPYTKNINISNLDTGIILLTILFIQSLSKLILFMYFDRKKLSI